MVEIGSDFWKAELKKDDIRYFLSGRTALEYIIRDILWDRDVCSVLLPSYCCHTMIEPFVRHGMDIRFYDVYFDKGRLCARIPEPREREIFFFIKYFGYQKLPGLDPESIRSRWDCMIQDCTHSWLMPETAKEFCDYRFTSYRKWTGTGAVASAERVGAHFHIEKPIRINKEYEKLIGDAEKRKKEYIEENRGDKKEYLKLFQEAEEELSRNYEDCVPEYERLYRLMNLDLNIIREKRRENAEVLLNHLKDMKELTPMISEIQPEDVPLFVPVMAEPGKRDLLRQYLIEKQIYCPVHWPASELHQISGRAKEIYDRELSLVCDQRYGRREMERMAEALKRFY